jgi:hypothetical protein
MAPPGHSQLLSVSFNPLFTYPQWEHIFDVHAAATYSVGTPAHPALYSM